VAGTVSRAIELKDIYRQSLAPLVAAQPTNPINPDLAIDTMKARLLNYKKKLAAEYVGTRFGIAYEEFLQHARERFGEDIFREVMSAISRQRQESQLLIATFFEDHPAVFRVEDWEGSLLEGHGIARSAIPRVWPEAASQINHSRRTPGRRFVNS
jgi:hypothetical protein